MEVSSYLQDNSETRLAAQDDTGLPENPVYSNFSKHLWKPHARHGLAQSPNRSSENTDGHRPTHDARSPDK